MKFYYGRNLYFRPLVADGMLTYCCTVTVSLIFYLRHILTALDFTILLASLLFIGIGRCCCWRCISWWPADRCENNNWSCWRDFTRRRTVRNCIIIELSNYPCSNIFFLDFYLCHFWWGTVLFCVRVLAQQLEEKLWLIFVMFGNYGLEMSWLHFWRLGIRVRVSVHVGYQ